MNTFMKINAFAFVFFLQFSIEAKQGLDFADTPTAKLIEYMDDSDGRTRNWAAYFLGFRYQHPQALNVRPLFYDSSKIAPVTVQVPASVVPKLFEKTQIDPELSVRLTALEALGKMSCRIDVIPLTTQCLTNSMRLVRLRACESLIKHFDEQGKEWPDAVISTLADCLSSTDNSDDLYLAVYSAGCLGTKGKPFVPCLEKLKTHPSSRIRSGAEDALQKIIFKKDDE